MIGDWNKEDRKVELMASYEQIVQEVGRLYYKQGKLSQIQSIVNGMNLTTLPRTIQESIDRLLTHETTRADSETAVRQFAEARASNDQLEDSLEQTYFELQYMRGALDSLTEIAQVTGHGLPEECSRVFDTELYRIKRVSLQAREELGVFAVICQAYKPRLHKATSADIDGFRDSCNRLEDICVLRKV
jgi:hypothetical protein